MFFFLQELPIHFRNELHFYLLFCLPQAFYSISIDGNSKWQREINFIVMKISYRISCSPLIAS